jgi:hypothetical protein
MGSFTFWDGVPVESDSDGSFDSGWDGAPCLVYEQAPPAPTMTIRWNGVFVASIDTSAGGKLEMQF